MTPYALSFLDGGRLPDAGASRRALTHEPSFAIKNAISANATDFQQLIPSMQPAGRPCPEMHVSQLLYGGVAGSEFSAPISGFAPDPCFGSSLNQQQVMSAYSANTSFPGCHDAPGAFTPYGTYGGTNHLPRGDAGLSSPPAPFDPCTTLLSPMAPPMTFGRASIGDEFRTNERDFCISFRENAIPSRSVPTLGNAQRALTRSSWGSDSVNGAKAHAQVQTSNRRNTLSRSKARTGRVLRFHAAANKNPCGRCRKSHIKCTIVSSVPRLCQKCKKSGLLECAA